MERNVQRNRKGIVLRKVFCPTSRPKKQEETIWLKEVDSIALQSSLRNLSDSFDRFFKKQNQYPCFKRQKNPDQSYTTKSTNGNITVLENKHKLLKIWLVRFAIRR